MVSRTLRTVVFLPLFLALCLASGLPVGSPPPASGQHVAVSAQATTLGTGGQVTVPLGREANLRAGGSYLPMHHQGTAQHRVEVRYDVTTRLAAAQLLLDWHPTDGPFRITVGGMYNASQVTGQIVDAATGTLVEAPVTPRFAGPGGDDVIDLHGDPLPTQTVTGGLTSFGIDHARTPTSVRVPPSDATGDGERTSLSYRLAAPSFCS